MSSDEDSKYGEQGQMGKGMGMGIVVRGVVH